MGRPIEPCPALEHHRTPFLDNLLEYPARGIRALHTPAHRGGDGAPNALAAVAPGVFALDLPSMEGTDSTFHPRGSLAAAERLAADLYGVEHTRFVAGGSTLGIQAAVLSVVGDGESILLPRNVHRSVLSALVISGARPRFILPRVDAASGALPINARQVAQALDADPSIRALLLTRPTYYGLAGELESIARLCRERGIPVVVDEAHGAHLAFLPPGAGPRSAVRHAVDIVVQSAHKTLGALIGGAWVHLPRGSRIPASRLEQRLNLLQTTSPSFPVLASLDAVRQALEAEGRERFDDAVGRVRHLRGRLDALPGVSVLAGRGNERTDPLRLVVDVRGLGLRGHAVQAALRARFGIEDELCDRAKVGFVLTPWDPPSLWEELLTAFAVLSRERRSGTPALASPLPTVDLPPPEVVLSPRQAVLAETERVPLEEAEGRVASEIVTVYPPGIPLVWPGERLTPAVLRVLRDLRADGLRIQASDCSLEFVDVLAP